MHRLSPIVVIALSILILVALFGCRKESEEETIKNILTGIQTAAEEKSTSSIMKHVSENYKDPQGTTHDSLKKLLSSYFLIYPKISVHLNYIQVSVSGASASARFQALLTSGQRKGSISDVIPDSLGVYRFNVSLEKQSGLWKIISANWESVNRESDAGE